jgi:hypothetical protein
MSNAVGTIKGEFRQALTAVELENYIASKKFT